MYGQKVLNILPFRFIGFFFRVFFDNSVRYFLYYLVKKDSVILRSLSCFNPYFLLLKYNHKHYKETKVMVYKTDSKVINGLK